MIFKTQSKKMSIKGSPAQSVQVSDELDMDTLYQDALASGYNVDQAVFEYGLLKLPRNAQTGSLHILVPGIHKQGSIASFNSMTRTLMQHRFSRPTPARYIDAHGRLQVADVDEPRLDWNVITRLSNGYLMEQGSVNLLPTSHGHIGPHTKGFTTSKSDVLHWGKVLEKPADCYGLNLHIGIIQAKKTYAYSAYVKIEDGIRPLKEHFCLHFGNKLIEDYSITFLCQGIYRIQAVCCCEDLKGYNWLGLETAESSFEYGIQILGEQLEPADQVSSYIPTDGNIAIRMADTLIVSQELPQAKQMLLELKDKPASTLQALAVFEDPQYNFIQYS
ncbi:hypothetical protein [Pedobacter antarcticus]|uniref:hypothetical protein n=1 Tax=Pedobacter antarcticus TaxID=34086 RepID=UPI00292F5C1C|nr:hypothetical protein [Pedobacter antarcticus]